MAELRKPEDTPLVRLEHKEVVQLAHLMRDVKFDEPPGDCLSPVGKPRRPAAVLRRPDCMHPRQVSTTFAWAS